MVWDIGLLLLLGTAVFFLGLGRPPLMDPDEPYYAIPAMEMLRTGSWQFALFHGAPWFDKPIFFYWLILGAYKLFGISEFSTRLGSAVAAMGTVLTLYALGRTTGKTARSPLPAAIVLATSFEFIVLARAAVTDMTLTFALTAGMLFVVYYLSSSRKIWAFSSGAAFGLATLTKGPVGLILPGVALLAYGVLGRRRDLLRPGAAAAAAAGAMGTAGPWFAYSAVSHPDLLYDVFIRQGNLGRFTSPEHGTFPFFYVAILTLGLLPWSGALPGSLARALRPSAWALERGPGLRPGPLYLVCWFGAVLTVFSVSASKLAPYILPAFPPASLLIGGYCVTLFERRRTEASRWTGEESLYVGCALAALLVAGVGLVMAADRFETAATAALLVGGLLLGGFLLGVAALQRRKLGLFLAAHTASSIGVVLTLLLVGLPATAGQKSTKALVEELARAGIAQDVVGVYAIGEGFSLDFYLGRGLLRIRNAEDLPHRVQQSPGQVWIVKNTRLSSLAKSSELAAEVVARGPRCSAVRLSPTFAVTEDRS